MKLLLSLLSEVFSPKGQLIKAWRYFCPGSQATLWHMLSDLACVPKSTVGQCEQSKNDVACVPKSTVGQCEQSKNDVKKHH